MVAIFVLLAGLMGAGGILLAAAGAHASAGAGIDASAGHIVVAAVLAI
jgi:hypothetical protein